MNVPDDSAARGRSPTAGRDASSRRLWSLVSGTRGGVVLLLICLAVYVPGLFTLPPVDRDESRFAQASRQMFESGDFAVPRVQDRPRLNKPPLIYWVQCGSLAIFGDHGRENEGIWVYRLPSALCAIGTVMLTWRLGRRLFDPRAAWLGAAFLAVCPMVVWDAHQARADQLLLLTVVASQFALWHVMDAHRRGRGTLGWALVFWLAIGAGIMAKGPITPMIAGLTAITVSLISRRWGVWRALRLPLGFVIIALMVGPWVYAVAKSVGFDQYRSIIWDETIGRSAGAKEGHWGPPGYHLVFSAVLLWPGSLMTAAGVVRAFGRARMISRFRSSASSLAAGRRGELFLLAWALPAWIVFELVSTKLPHYTMPLYPPLALLSARMVLSAASRGPGFVRDAGQRLGEGIWILVGLAIAAASPAIWVALAHPMTLPRPSWPVPLHAAMLVLGVWLLVRAIHRFRKSRMLAAQLCGLAIAILTPLVLIESKLAREPGLSLSPRLAEAIWQIDPQRTRPIASVEYHEDSFVFATRGRVRKLDEGDLDAFVAKNPGAIVIAPLRVVESRGWKSEAALTGFNYSVGRWTSVVIVSPDAPEDPNP
jgi:4-amino-4-deoxy-L-arabinose transferase-like glycosyltransferase